MHRFAQLVARLDETTKTNEKVAALADYFQEAEPADAAWAIHFLSGRKLKRLVKTNLLRQWAIQESGLPEWLFAESYDAVGDLAETIALLLPPGEGDESLGLAGWVEERLLPLAGADESEQRETIVTAWRSLDEASRFVLGKLITGSFRVGVSQRLVTRGLAEASGVDAESLAHRLMGPWKPTAPFFQGLIDPDTRDAEAGRPYPFCLAHPLEQEPESLGDPHEWQAEWKWDGIRAQLIRRGAEHWIWSRGEELMNGRFPEIEQLAPLIPPGTVLDGELLAWKDGQVLPFGVLQKRIGRKQLGKKILAEAPVAFLAFDVLEQGGLDLRETPLEQRRRRLEELLAAIGDEERLLISQPLVRGSWEELAAEREQSRQRHTEGLMLKRLDSPYAVGRARGGWWKWKVEPYTIDAVLIYAQRGHGRRASLYTDYTFAVWDGEELVPFAKAYSGLTDAEIRRVDRFVRQNTREKFGPVRSVTPELVFELAFENIQRSSRHRSGIAVRFPRIVRWREDKPIQEADRLETIRGMLPGEE